MKLKLIILAVIVMFLKVAEAQTFGIRGGFNIAKMNISTNGMGITPQSIEGVHFGPIVDFEIAKSIYFNTGLLYSLKGMKVLSNNVSARETLNYLEVPLNFARKFTMDEKSIFFVQAGPYLGYAMSGKDKTGSTSEDIVFGGADNNKRFDFGVGIGTGIEFGPMIASVEYQFGISRIVEMQDPKITNRVIQISVSYMFRK